MNPFRLNQQEVGPVGLGCAALSYPGITAEDAAGTVAAALEAGIRTFDAAPFYGSGLSEVRLGQALAGITRESFTLSTKVGRLVDEPDANGVGTGTHFDFSAEAIHRSLEASLTRLGLDRVDILFIHDAGNDMDQAIAEAFPVLEEYRRQGVVQGIGAGMGDAAMLARFARETSMDIFLAAGSYSLLDRTALDELFPLCAEKGIAVIVAQMLVGGLIEGVSNPMFHYKPVTPEVTAQVERIIASCHRHGVPSAAAAIQFPLGYPAVTGIVTGPRNASQLCDNLAWFHTQIPPTLWDDLRSEGLLDPDTLTPTT